MTLSYVYLGNDDETVPREVQELIMHSSLAEIPDELCFFRFRQLVHVDLTSCLQLTRIGRLAFGWCNLIRSIEIPSSVIVIEEGAFESCISLETVVFDDDSGPSSLTTIGERAFNCCESLTDIEIPSSVEVIRESAFRRCTSLTQVFFDLHYGSLKVIASGAFQECPLLEHIDLPRSLETLGSEAFRDCTSLWEVSLPEDLHEIGSRAFYGCCSLSVVNMTSRRISMEITDENDTVMELSPLFSGVRIIGEYAFCGCEALTSVVLPPSVTEIQRGAFQDCSNLISVEFAERHTALSIQYFAFYCCESLVNIALPATTVAEGFGSCTLLCDNYGATNLPEALVRRFSAYPIHKLCYQTSVTTKEDLMQAIERSPPQWMMGDENELKTTLVDPFGMTPFHILLSSANGRHRMDLLRILLLTFPPGVLGWKDTFGTLAIEYCWEYKWNEDTRRLVRMILRHWMVGSIEGWGGLDSWKRSMSNHIELFLAEDGEEESNRLFHAARKKLAAYELWENTSLLELCLWKMTILRLADQNVSSNLGVARMLDNDGVCRETCRIQCGASVVLPNVTQFLQADPIP